MNRIVAAGSGRMGCSMAIAFAYAGKTVDLLDLKIRDDAGVSAHRDAITKELNGHLGTLARIGVLGESDVDRILARIRVHSRADAAPVLTTAELVLEGVPERLEDKKQALEFLESGCSEHCVLASTTSSFLATELAAFLKCPGRFLNAHWLNPAYVIPLVELSPHPATDAAVTQSVFALLEQIGKTPVICQPSPGYIVPRLQALVMNEAARLVEEGVASAQDVDKAVRLGFGMRYASMGLLEFVDFGGMDILQLTSQYMAKTVDPNRYALAGIVEKMMADGHDGVRSGRGFYDWSGKDVPAYRDEVVGRLADLLRREGLMKPPAGD